MFSGNEVSNSLPCKLFWAGGSGRLKEQKKEKEEMLKYSLVWARHSEILLQQASWRYDSYFTAEDTEAQS